MSAPLAEQIYTAVKPLPERYLQEVLDFVEFLSTKAKQDDAMEQDLIRAQSLSIQTVWGNQEDEVWNDVKPI